jgi:hypothetical protein
LLDPRVEAQQLTTFADRLVRLAPCHRDPERFHAEKHALVGDLRRAARELELFARSQAALAAAAGPVPRETIRLGLVRMDRRVVPVEARRRRVRGLR